MHPSIVVALRVSASVEINVLPALTLWVRVVLCVSTSVERKKERKIWKEVIDLQFVVDVWGPRACFTPPYAKVERLSLPVPTPSAMRGLLAAIYCKPNEFYWSIDEIQVLNPIKFQSCKRNEVQVKVSRNRPIITDEVRTQRAMTMLVDVHYRVTATMHPAFRSLDFEKRLQAQMERRLQDGKCFYQPCFGLRECECYFGPGDMHADKRPISVTQDFGLMTFDTHVPGTNTPGDDTLNLSLYHCTMVNGVIRVPAYDSPAVLKLGNAAELFDGIGGVQDAEGAV